MDNLFNKSYDNWKLSTDKNYTVGCDKCDKQIDAEMEDFFNGTDLVGNEIALCQHCYQKGLDDE